jgi:hypothetical protein
MEYLKAKIIKLLIEFYEDDYRRITHALNVLEQAENILKTKTGYDEDIIIACSLLHDAGIKQSEKELGYNNGKTQERFGPPASEEIMNYPAASSGVSQKTETFGATSGGEPSARRSSQKPA